MLKTFARWIKRFAREGEEGQVLPLVALLALALVVLWLSAFNLGQAAAERMKMQDIADTSAYSSAVWGARTLNLIAYTNRTLIAHHVLMTQMTIMRSHSVLIYKMGVLPYVGGFFRAIGVPYEMTTRAIAMIGLPTLQIINDILLYFQRYLYHTYVTLGATNETGFGGLAQEVARQIDPEVRINPIQEELDEAAVGLALNGRTLLSYDDLVKPGKEDGSSAFNPKISQEELLRRLVINTIPQRSDFAWRYANGRIIDWWIIEFYRSVRVQEGNDNHSIDRMVLDLWLFTIRISAHAYTSMVHSPEGVPLMPTGYQGLPHASNSAYELPIRGVYEINRELDKDLKTYDWVQSNCKARHYVAAFKNSDRVGLIQRIGIAQDEDLFLPGRFLAFAKAEVLYYRPDRPTEPANLWNPFWTARLVAIGDDYATLGLLGKPWVDFVLQREFWKWIK